MSNIIKAIQLLYPNIQGGFVYWETKQDGTAWENPIDGLAWENTEFAKPTWEQIESNFAALELEEAKSKKKVEIKAFRDLQFAKPLLFRSNPDLYLKPQPQTNIFLAAHSMPDGATKDWLTCDADGVMTSTFTEVTKAELVSISDHYEERKTTAYNQAHLKCFTIDALTTIAEVEAFDIRAAI